MDYVYICRPGDNEELRYSIRSVLANAPEGNVWVVGGRPEWYCGNYIYVSSERSKYGNARMNLEAIMDSQDISEEFVLMNDDFFIVKPITEIKYYYNGPLNKIIEQLQKRGGSAGYLNLLIKTYKALIRNKVKEPLNYDIHVPMVINKTKLRKIFDQYQLWRSSYGNVYKVGGEYMRDVKYHTNPIHKTSFNYLESDLPYLSTEDDSFDHVIPYLEEMFPYPSPYELDKS